MELERLTTATRRALGTAQTLAQSENHQYVEPAHLGLALLGETDGLVYPLLGRLGVAPTALRDGLQAVVGRLPKVYGASEVTISRSLGTLLREADAERTHLGDDYLSVEHLLLALAATTGATGDAFRHLGI